MTGPFIYLFSFSHTDLCVPLDGQISVLYVCERKRDRNSFRKGDNLTQSTASSRQMFLAEIAEVHLKTCIAARNDLHLF